MYSLSALQGGLHSGGLCGSDESQHAIGLRFSPLKRKHPRMQRGIKRKGANNFNATEFLQNLEDKLPNDLHNTLNYIRVSLSCIKKAEMKLLGEILTCNNHVIPVIPNPSVKIV